MADIDVSSLMKSMNSGGKNYQSSQNKSSYSNNRNGGYQNRGYQNGGYQNRGFNAKSNASDDKYAGAPYNFIPFYDNVVKVDAEKLKNHGCISKELFSGEISYKIQAETPIFISDGHNTDTSTPRFVRNENGDFIIPGSSMRGLIRNNVQILGLSGFDQDIDDYNLMYRNVTFGAEKKRYNEVLGAKQVSVVRGGKPIGALINVKAGYIAKEGSKYYIYQTEVETIQKELGEMNYFILSERSICKDVKAYPYFQNNPSKAMHDLNKGFTKEEKNGRTHYKGVENKLYVPGFEEISYEIKNLKNVEHVGKKGVFSKEGYLLSTGPMKERKVHYIIPKIDRSKEKIEVSEADIRAFKIDFEKKKNTLKRFNNVDFFNLPSGNAIKPVFYIRLDGRLYFGFTPRLRLFYDYSIKDGLKQKKQDCDYAKSIFGMISESSKEGYKSKVSFSDAVISERGEEIASQKVILAEPKPTSYLDYVEQRGEETTYNAKDFCLRGVKQYWLRKNSISCEMKEGQDKVASLLTPLESGTVFRGKVRFQNLTKAELGLLLWGLRLEKESRMNIGMGKPFGYGVISVSDLAVKLVDVEKAYALDSLSLNPFVAGDVDEFIHQYKQEISSQLNGKEVDKLPHILDFFAMKNPNIAPADDKIRYMKLDDKEYQSRTKKLPKINELTKK